LPTGQSLKRQPHRWRPPPVQGVHENNLENTLYRPICPTTRCRQSLTKLPCATFTRGKGGPHLGQRMKCHKIPATPNRRTLPKLNLDQEIGNQAHCRSGPVYRPCGGYFGPTCKWLKLANLERSRHLVYPI